MKENTRRLEKLYNASKVEIKDYTLEKLFEAKDEKVTIVDCGYQREFMWDNVQSSNLVETVLLNSLIPPFIIMEDKEKRIIIDGKQRYESLLRFYQNKFALKLKGLTVLKDLYDKYYNDLPTNARTIFNEYKIKALCYTVDDMSFSEKDKDFLQRDIYIRYNYGKTPLKLSEIGRAKYLFDPLTQDFILYFKQNPNIYNECVEIFLPKTRRTIGNDREKINLLMATIREILVTPYVPIMGEKYINIGNKIVDPYYSTFFGSLSNQKRDEVLTEFLKILNKLSQIKEKFKLNNNELYDNVLFYKATYWMFAILYKVYSNEFYQFNIDKLCHYIEDGGEIYFQNYNNNKKINIRERYEYLGEYIQTKLKLDLSSYKEDIKENKLKTRYTRKTEIDRDKAWNGIQADKQLIANVETMVVSEVLDKLKQKRFIIQSAYQRSEVKDIYKASKIIESIILGIKLPPIYLYVTTNPEDGLNTYTVMDRTAKTN